MNPKITDAERAAKAAFKHVMPEISDDTHESLARLLVAAVHEPLAAEELRAARKAITEHKEALRENRQRLGQKFEGRLLGLEEAAGLVTTHIKGLRK